MADAARSQLDTVADYASLAERLRALFRARLLIAGATLGAGLLLAPRFDTLLLAGALGLGLLLLLDLRGRRQVDDGHRPGMRQLLLPVLVEGASIVLVLHALGTAGAPLRYALVIQAASIALLLSHRVGVRSAVWVSLLLLVSTEMSELEIGVAPEVAVTGGSTAVLGLLIAIWAATLLTASASAVNERGLRRERLEQHLHASFGQAAEAATSPLEIASALAEHIARTGIVNDALVVELRSDPTMLARARGDVSRTRLSSREGSLIGRCVAERGPVHLRRLDPELDPELTDLLFGPTNVTAVPMISKDDVVGVVVIVHGDGADGAVRRRSVQSYQQLAAHGGLAIANAWASEALDRQARTDGLTGVANRRMFDDQLLLEIERAQRSNEPLSLVIADVDHFKRFNDTHGHQEGDRVLVGVAATLEQERRPYDLVARYGGEEFAVILPQTGEAGAVAAAERFRVAIEGRDDLLGVTASFGVTTTTGATTPKALIEAADAGLYAAKAAGRNQVALVDGDGAVAAGRTPAEVDATVADVTAEPDGDVDGGAEAVAVDTGTG